MLDPGGIPGRPARRLPYSGSLHDQNFQQYQDDWRQWMWDNPTAPENDVPWGPPGSARGSKGPGLAARLLPPVDLSPIDYGQRQGERSRTLTPLDPSGTPTYARGVAPEALVRPQGGYDPTAWESLMQSAYDESNRVRPPSNELSVARHQLPIRNTPPRSSMFTSIPAEWSPEDLAKGRRTPLPDESQQGFAGYARDLATSTRANVARGGKAVERIAGGVTSLLTRDQAGTAEHDPLGAAGQLFGSAVSTIFDPFIEAGSRVIVNSDPTLRAEFRRRGGGSGAAEAVIDELRTAALNRANDPNLAPGDRFDAGGIASILGLYRAGEFGAPQAIAGLSRLGAKAIANQLRYEARGLTPTSGIERLMETRAGNVAPPGEYSRVPATEPLALPPGQVAPVAAARPPRAATRELNPETRSGKVATRPAMRVGENGLPRPATAEELHQQALADVGIATGEQWAARISQAQPREVQLYAEKPSGGLKSAVEGWVVDEQGMARLDLGAGTIFYHVSPNDIEAPQLGQPAKRYRQEGGILGMFMPPKVVTLKSKAFFMSQDPKLLSEVAQVRLGGTGAPGKTYKVVKVYGGELDTDRVLRLDQYDRVDMHDLTLRLIRGTKSYRDQIMNGATENDLASSGMLDEGNFAQWMDDPKVIERLNKKYDAVVFNDLGYGRSVAVLKPDVIQGFRQYVGRAYPGHQLGPGKHGEPEARVPEIIRKGEAFAKGEGGSARIDMGIGNVLKALRNPKVRPRNLDVREDTPAGFANAGRQGLILPDGGIVSFDASHHDVLEKLGLEHGGEERGLSNFVRAVSTRRGEVDVQVFKRGINEAQLRTIEAMAETNGNKIRFDLYSETGNSSVSGQGYDSLERQLRGFLADEGGSLPMRPENTFGKFLRSDEGIGGPPQLEVLPGGKQLPVLQRPAPKPRDAQQYLSAAGERDRMQARLAGANKVTTEPTTTWVFTDVQGSTDLIRNKGPQVMQQVMATQKKVLSEVFGNEDGELIRSTGDGFFWRFPNQAQAATAAAEAQRQLNAVQWPSGTKPKIRMGLHSGPATAGSAASGVDFVGEPIHYASRLTNLAKGGEIIVSDEVAKAIGLTNAAGGAPLGRTVRADVKDYGTRMAYHILPEDAELLSQAGQGYWANHPAVKEIEAQLHEPQYRFRNQQITREQFTDQRATRVAEAFMQKYAPDAVKGKRAIIVLGYSGAGKSTIARPGGEIDTTGFLPMGADDFKPIILDDYLKTPEPYPFHGNLTENNIARVSDELRQDLQETAMKAGYNFVIGPVGRNPNEIMDTIALLKQNGYSVELPFLDVPAQVAIGRTIKRFLQAGGLDSTMRYIRPGYTYGAVGKPQALVAQLLRNMATGKGVQVDGISIWDGSGLKPRLVHQSGSPVAGGANAGAGNGPGGQLSNTSATGAGPLPIGKGSVQAGAAVGQPRPGPLPVSGSPNFAFNQFPPNTQDALAKMQEAVQPNLEKARPVIPFAEQNAPTDLPIWELASRLPAAGDVSIPVAQVRQATADLLNQTQEYRNKVDAGTITPQEQAEYAMKLKIAALGRIAEVGAVSESARVTGGVRMPLRQQLRTTTTARAIDELFSDLAANHPEKLDQLATALSTLGNEPRKVMRLMKQVATKADFWQRFDEYYRSNVLWNIATHVTNTSSGLYQTALLGARESLYGLSDVRPGSQTRGVAAFAEDTTAMLLGWAQGYVQALDMLRGIREMLPMNADKYGGAMGFSHTGALGSPSGPEAPGMNPLQPSTSEGLWGLGKYYGPVLRTPFRFLEAADLFQTAPMYNGLLRRNAVRLARQQGARGWQEVDQRAQQILRDMPDEINAEEAFMQAEEFALHGSGDAAKAIGELRRAVPALRPVVLFINTPTNLISLSARFSPLGFARIPYAGVKKLTGRQSEDFDPRRAFIEAGIGSAVVGGFLLMLQSDNAVGLTPKSKAEQQAWEAQGRQPLSIRASEYPILGPMLSAYYNMRGQDPQNVWVGPQLLGPLLIPYLMAAAYHEVTRAPSKDPIENQIATAAANAGKTLMDQIPLFSTYSMIANAADISNPDAFFRLLARLGLPVIPAETLFKMVGDMQDGFRRDAKTFDEIIKANFPFLREQVRPKLDVLGKPLPGNVVPFDVGPRARAAIEPDPVLAESEKLRKAHPEEWSGLVKPGRNVAGEDLNYDQAQRYVEVAGEKRRALLLTLMEMPEYQSLSGTEQAKAYHATDAEALREGRKQLGLEMAQAAQDIPSIQRAVTVALTGANNNYERGQVLTALRDQGKLKPEVAAGLDSARNQPDPLRGNYQLSVAEYMRGVELIDKYRAAPAFIIGDSPNKADWPKEWAAAADAALTYNALRDVYERKAKLQGTKIQLLPEYEQLLKYYESAANGLLARYYTTSGSVREGLVSAERKAIKADPLWSNFSGSAEPQPAVPYRFPVPQPVLPSSGVPQGQQLAAVAG